MNLEYIAPEEISNFLNSQGLLCNFESVEELKKELKKEGFDVINGAFFIQDIEGLKLDNCDNISPFDLLQFVIDSKILENEECIEAANLFIERFSFDDLLEKAKEEKEDLFCNVKRLSWFDMYDIACDEIKCRFGVDLNKSELRFYVDFEEYIDTEMCLNSGRFIKINDELYLSI